MLELPFRVSNNFIIRRRGLGALRGNWMDYCVVYKTTKVYDVKSRYRERVRKGVCHTLWVASVIDSASSQGFQKLSGIVGA